MQKPTSLPASPPPGGSGASAGADKFRCGTLVYTKGGLFVLFSWLLWGDFCFSLMEAIWPAIIPLVLKSHDAPNFVIAIVMVTIPQAMNFVLNPIISTASDRYRGKRGRRIPFLFFSAPIISFFLILMGFSQEIGRWLHAAAVQVNPGITVSAVTVGLICVLIVAFRFFELFVSTIFYYLFNDVVPTAFMGRFYGFFKVVGTLAGAAFHFFVFQYATTHTSVIFLGAAILYGTAFILLGLNVKEGEYPPPEPMMGKKLFSLAPIKTFFKECMSARIFRLIFAYSAFLSASGVINTFMIFMALSIGLSIGDVGKINGLTLLASTFIMFPMGILVDKIHPLRVMIISQIGYLAVALMKCVFLFRDFPPNTAFWIFAGMSAFYLPFSTANAMAGLPMVMRLFPHERFGQFCAANAMAGAGGTVVAGAVAGGFLDLLRRVFADSGDYYYRFVPAWTSFFMIITLFMIFRVYREWKRLGGDKGYKPPIEDRFADYHAPSVNPAGSS